MSGGLQNALTHYLGSSLPLDHVAYDQGGEIVVTNASSGMIQPSRAFLASASHPPHAHHHSTQPRPLSFEDEACWAPIKPDKPPGSQGGGWILTDNHVFCRATVTDRSSGTIVVSGDWGGDHVVGRSVPVTVYCWGNTDNGGATRTVPRAVDGLTPREGYGGWAEISDKPAATAFSTPPWHAAVLERLSHLIGLNEGWDGPGSASISVEVAVRAFEVLIAVATDKMLAPAISPSHNGDLQLAWYAPDLELEIDIPRDGDDPVIAFYDRNSGEESELTLTSPEMRAAIERLAAG